ncbi:hypothetical protein [Bacillus pseudomycoides]|uniref:hypothetical protein n=1 Tax=Bacillus pseudomycoides TaxID=64104 RepID=UPI001FB44B65|nr:hypothetical protein [Bacillus pseudomycoides]
MIGKDFSAQLREWGYDASSEVSELTNEVVYIIEGEVISSNDIYKSKYASLLRRYTMFQETQSPNS